MAVRYGGRHELEGGTEALVLPAEASSDRNERESLRKELDEVRKQGEVYARELAAVFDRGEDVATVSSLPPAPGAPAAERFAAITKLCAGVGSELRVALGPLARDLAAIRRHDVTDEQLETLRRRVSHMQELVAGLRSIGGLPPHELATEIDLAEVAKGAARDGNAFGERNDVKVVVRQLETQRRLYVRGGAKSVAALARELVAHAVAASPRAGTVEISLDADASGPRLVVDDSGSPLPASGRRAFLVLDAHAGQYGRPSALPIFMAAELAACVGARLELSDSPARDSAGGPVGGGLRVTVSFGRA
jgi:signal transduction histidine kinase